MEPSFPTVSLAGYRRSITLRVLGFFAGAVIALAVFALVKAPGGMLGAWSILTLPAELRESMLVIQKGGGESAAYTPGSLWQATPGTFRGTPASFSYENGNVLAIRVMESDTSVLEENGVERVRAGGMLAAPSKAPYTNVIAYAERIRAHTEPPTDLPPQFSLVSPEEWDIQLQLPGNAPSERLVSGYAPLFFDDTLLFFISPSGIYRYNLTTGEAVRVLDRRFPITVGPVLQSPDRTLIGLRDPIAKATLVYRVHETELLLVREVPEVLFSPALSNDALYDLKGTQTGGEVWKYAFDGGEPVRIHTFPTSLVISRIVF